VTAEFKGHLDPVTEADRASERFLTETLAKLFPEDGFLGEEGAQRPTRSGYLWVADPLDGTVNFAHGNPHYSVSLALFREGLPVAGCVAHGAVEECYRAERGAGAFRGDARLKASSLQDPDGALAATDFPYDRQARTGRGVARIKAFLGAFQSLRIQGSAALELCRIAAGELDVYAGDGTRPWDVGAAGLILEEAGGRLTTWKGEGLDWLRPTFPLATNGPLHPFALKLFEELDAC
jgi:myo-inositol-1(or 4)-monophosphatase